ncbi:3-dehydroquinate synthase [Candidatus Uhrbacteria bacterium]|nr:3-dehydroquinate synthase [Candidatus Uhrbacteria bacterium]
MKTHTLTIRIPSLPIRSYHISIGSDVVSTLVRMIQKNFHNHTIAIITDKTVRRLYGNALAFQLRKKINRVHLFSLPAGETFKNEGVKTLLDHGLLKKECGRNTLIIALGGGVVGDMAGFVASTYLRGVPYIQIPTTLLAMLDSSIGGKTGIDTTYGKNTIGTFWQPSAVLVNTSYLKTLSDDHWRSGLMEAVKISLTMRPEMQKSLRGVMKQRSEIALRNIIRASLQEKARIVEKDEKEQGERMVLNFGHTIGHAIEKVSNYSILHGIAVGLGMLIEARISHELGILSTQSLKQVEGILKSAGVSTKALRKWKPRDIIAATKYDKKKQGDKPLYILLSEIGSIYKKDGAWAHPVRENVVKKVLL